MAKGLDGFLDVDTTGQADAQRQSAADEPATGSDPAPAAEAAPAPTSPKEPTPAEAPATEEPEQLPEDVVGLQRAIRAERAKRNDYKGERDKLAGEIAAIKEQLARQAAPAPPPAAPAQEQQQQPQAREVIPSPLEDPAGYHAYLQRELWNERLNNSEMRLREKHDDVDAKIEVFKKEAANNPAMRAEFARQLHPYDFAYKQAERIMAMAEVGPDPAAFRAKVAAEERAKILAEMQTGGGGEQGLPNGAGGAPMVNIPPSLATMRSAGPRTPGVAPAPEFEDIFARKKRR